MGVIALTLLVVGFMGFAPVLMGLSCVGGCVAGDVGLGVAARAVLVAAMSLVFLVGLWWAWMVATGRSLKHGNRDEVRPAPEQPTRVWRVAAPGADLKEYPLHDQAMARLEAGVVVGETRRLGEHVRVSTPGGLEGWVPAGRLEPYEDGRNDDA